MRLLLDECVPRRFAREFVGHDVATVVEAGWSGLSNGDLLRAAALEFDVFVTVDQGVEFQQRLAAAPIGVLVLVASSNTIDSLRELFPKALEVVLTVSPGQLVRVTARPRG